METTTATSMRSASLQRRSRLVLAAFAFFVALFLSSRTARADTVTPPTPIALHADTNRAASTGAGAGDVSVSFDTVLFSDTAGAGYTTGAGSNITITARPGFQFDPSFNVSMTSADYGINGNAAGVAASITPTGAPNEVLSFTLTSGGTAASDVLTITGIHVRILSSLAGVGAQNVLAVDTTAAGGSTSALATGVATISAGGAHHLTFTTQPASILAGSDLLPAVTIADFVGNVVSGDDRSITLQLQTNPTGATLLGTTAKSSSSGVASWLAADDLSVNKVGSGYTLHATHDGAGFFGTDTVDSTAFNVTSTLAITPATTSVAPNEPVTFGPSGGTGPYSFAIVTNPSGATLVGGLYTAGNTPSMTDIISLTDALTNTVTRSISVGPGVSLSPLTPTAAPLQTVQFTASGGNGVYTWSVVANNSGANVSTSGLYTAGPTASMIDTLRVVDAFNNQATTTISVSAALSVVPSASFLAPSQQETFTASGGGGGYVFSLTANPSGGNVTPGGVYTAGTIGSRIDKLRVVDVFSNQVNIDITVGPNVSFSAPGSVAPLQPVTLIASGGSGSGYVFSFDSNPSTGSLTPGGSYQAGPNGGFSDVIRLTDSLNNTVTATIAVGPNLAIIPAAPINSPPNGGVAFSISGGSGTVALWEITTNNSNGSINAAGAYVAGTTPNTIDTITATDTLGNVATRNVNVGLGLTASPPAGATPPLGTIDFDAAGGTGGPFVWSFLTTNSGSPALDTATGIYKAGAIGARIDTIRATDGVGNTIDVTITVGAGVSIAPATPPAVPTLGTIAFTSAGGSGTGFVWSILPNNSGAAIDSTGHYTAGATPNAVDTVRVTDSLGNVGSVNIPVGGALAINPATSNVPPRGSIPFVTIGGSGVGLVWSFAVNASGGTINSTTGAYVAGPTGSVVDQVRVVDSVNNQATVSVNVGPPLVSTQTPNSIAPRGSIELLASGGGSGRVWSFTTNASGGTLDAAGNYRAGPTGGVADIVHVVDSLGNSASGTITVTAAMTIAPSPTTSPPKGTKTFTAAAGAGGYVFSLQTNASGGTVGPLTGLYTAGATGNVNDIVLVTDTNGATAMATIAVGPAISITPPSPSVAALAPLAFSATGGSGTGYVWLLSGNASGGSINASTGAYLSGPTEKVVDHVEVTDSVGNTASVNISVGGVLAITPASPTTPPRGNITFSAVGGTGIYTWSFVSSPSGGSIDPATGVYRAGSIGNVLDRVRLTDSANGTLEQDIVVGPGITLSPAKITVAPGATTTFAVAGGSGKYSWSIEQNRSGGKISVVGVYVAGSITGGVIDIIAVKDDLGNAATAEVTIGIATNTPPPPPVDAGAPSPPPPPEDRSCGCKMVGKPSSSTLSTAAGLALALLAIARRRRKGRTSPGLDRRLP